MCKFVLSLKPGCFIILILIDNQNLKKFSTLFLRHLPKKKLATKFMGEIYSETYHHEGFMVGPLIWRS